MILRDLVGGGGSANESLAAAVVVVLLAALCTVEDLRRDLTVSLACSGYVVVVVAAVVAFLGWLWRGLDSESGGEAAATALAWLPLMAGGGSSKDICSEASCLVPSWLLRSVDDAGVRGCAARGIVSG
jgi:hypothetical protein